MKNYRKVSAIIGLVVIAAALFLGWRYLTLSSSSSRSAVSGIDTLRINVENADIYVESTEGSGDKTEVEIKAKGKYRSSDIDVKTENNAVDIKQVGHPRLFTPNFDFGSRLDIYVKLPASRKDTLNVSSQNGKVSIDNVNSRIITVVSENGTIQMNRITGSKLLARSSSGAIRLEELTVSKVETIAESGSSRLVFSDKLNEIIANSSSTSGSIDYEFHNDIKLNLKSSGKLISRIDSDTASPNTIDMQSESGRMSVSRK
ncbi:DUF4097 family beta strand repeat-containing protein [Paenibacillus favisporus]|uniref:DUF4097 family beta strand repeat-containing protein n=1 Tax=Paenibacillus TaxID=44249 RepID=UPI001643323F|nr:MULTISPECIES: DUF4097 family beta strand repeat-containing protein [Paenibacillus]MEC0175089.1 DUF4097 family beta strand repeat-containing protein [Paenibacillus favisporus]